MKKIFAIGVLSSLPISLLYFMFKVLGLKGGIQVLGITLGILVIRQLFCWSLAELFE